METRCAFLLRKASPTIIRYPGGCFTSFQDWKDAIGHRNERVPKESYYWGGMEDNDVGIDEFLDLCSELGIEPQVNVNMMTGSAFSAAELVEYCNGTDESHMGRLRVLNSVKRNIKVKYWEMENEASRKWSALQYANKVVEFVSEMKRVDPEIKIIMDIYSYGLEWVSQMLEIAGNCIDYVSHRRDNIDFLKRCLLFVKEYNDKNGTSIGLVNSEWLPDGSSAEPFKDPEIPQNYRWSSQIVNDYKKVLSFREIHWFYGLNIAKQLLEFMTLGGGLFLVNFNNCANTWGQCIIEASKEGAWFSPPGHVFQFFNYYENQNTFPLKTSLESQNEFITVQACECADGGINIYVVNRGSADYQVSIELPDDFKTKWGKVLFAPDKLVKPSLEKCEIECKNLETTDDGKYNIMPLSVTRIYAK